MNRKKNKLFVWSILWIALVLMMAACSSSTPANNTGSQAPANKPEQKKETGGEATKGQQEEDEAFSYPVDTDVELTHWYQAHPNQLAVVADSNDFPIFQDLEKLTGIKVKYVTPAVNQGQEQLNIMFASGEYTDIIEWNFLNAYPGGPEKAIKDGNIMRLNELFEEHAPNLMRYLQAHPEVDKMIKTDNGTYYGFPFIRGDDYLRTYGGPIIRKDWLDDLGLEIPTTIDEWHTVLTAFKNEKGADAPLTFDSVPRLFDGLATGSFIGAFGVKRDFFMVDGEVKFGPAEPGYREFLATFRQWYAEGLIDKDIATVDNKIKDANMTSGKSGATYALAGGGIGKWLGAMAEVDPNYNLAGAPYPVLNKGDVPMFGQKDFNAPTGGGHAISPKSKHPELAVRQLDFGYSEEGQHFFNFGTEGVSHTMIDGYPTYTDMIKEDYSLNLGLYTRSTGGPTIQDKRYYEQFAALPQQKDAVSTWMQTDVDKYQLPPISPTPEESSEAARIMTEVNTLVDETTIKIVLGTEPLESYEDFLKKLDALNIKRAIEIYQAALDRYNSR